MLNNKNSYISLYIFPLLLFILYATEAYFKIRKFNFGETSIILKTVKLLVLLGVTIYIVKSKPRSFFLPLLLLLFFCIGQIALLNSFKMEIIVEFSKFLYLILLLVFFNLFKLSELQKNKLLFSFELLLVFNSILVLLGFCFDIMVFKTYDGNRFGYNGLLITSSTATYFYIIALIYLLYKYRQNLFNVPISYLILTSAFMVGTKSLYFFIVGFFTVYTLWFLKTRIKKLILAGFLFLALVVGYLFFFEFGLFNEIRKSEGLFTAIFSYRDQLFYENTLPFIKSNWNYINYLFGGINDLTTKSQIDILDVFYFFGILGGALFLYMFLQIFIKSSIKPPFIILLSLMMFIICFAGNFFSYASIAIYVAILSETINKYEYS